MRAETLRHVPEKETVSEGEKKQGDLRGLGQEREYMKSIYTEKNNHRKASAEPISDPSV